jgi:hypothetical protein
MEYCIHITSSSIYWASLTGPLLISATYSVCLVFKMVLILKWFPMHLNFFGKTPNTWDNDRAMIYLHLKKHDCFSLASKWNE